MHFIVSSSQLLRHLSSLSGVLNSSNTLPILDNFLFELGPGEAIISASDLEVLKRVCGRLRENLGQDGCGPLVARATTDASSQVV